MIIHTSQFEEVVFEAFIEEHPSDLLTKREILELAKQRMLADIGSYLNLMPSDLTEKNNELWDTKSNRPLGTAINIYLHPVFQVLYLKFQIDKFKI